MKARVSNENLPRELEQCCEYLMRKEDGDYRVCVVMPINKQQKSKELMARRSG